MSDKTRDILFKARARLKISQGLSLVSDVLKATFGLKSTDYSLKELTTQAIDELCPKDNFEKIGVELAKLTAQRIKASCQDGEATTIMLLDVIVKAGIRLLNEGIDPLSINKALDISLNQLLEEINKMAYPISDYSDILKVASMYSSGNERIAILITDYLQKVGSSGVVILEKMQDPSFEIEISTALELNLGYASSHFCTDRERKTIEFNACDVLIINQKISSIQELLPFLVNRAFSSRELLIFAEDIQADVISSLALNNLKKIFNIALIKVSSKKGERKKILSDIAQLTGAKIGILDCLKSNNISGHAKKVIITKNKTLIIPSENFSRTNRLHFEKKIALVNCQIFSKTEEQIFRDCLFLTQKSLELGVIAGGGISLIFALKALKDKKSMGIRLIKNALQAPFCQLIKNVAYEPSPILKEVSQLGYPNGFNIIDKKVEDLMKKGIFDSIEVIKSCLSHAIGAAKEILLTDAIIVDEKEDL